jgi:hypothetical protein
LILRLRAQDAVAGLVSADASSGAVPFQDANRLQSANRLMLPTSASSRAALEGADTVQLQSAWSPELQQGR